jgi:hypothetical protein
VSTGVGMHTVPSVSSPPVASLVVSLEAGALWRTRTGHTEMMDQTESPRRWYSTQLDFEASDVFEGASRILAGNCQGGCSSDQHKLRPTFGDLRLAFYSLETYRTRLADNMYRKSPPDRSSLVFEPEAARPLVRLYRSQYSSDFAQTDCRQCPESVAIR